MNLIDLSNALLETLLMTFISTLFAYLIGLPLGVILNATSSKGVCPNKIVNTILGIIVNTLRSIPCLLLIIILIPLSNVILGKGQWSGNWYSMVIPLVFASFPYVARLVDQSLNEVDVGEVEAIRSLGASNWQLITKEIIPEAKPSLISGFAVTIVSIIGYTSFAGYIAGGGLIVEAFNLGYYGTDKLGMWICIIFVVIVVQVLQESGLWISKKIDKRRITK